MLKRSRLLLLSSATGSIGSTPVTQNRTPYYVIYSFYTSARRDLTGVRSCAAINVKECISGGVAPQSPDFLGLLCYA